MTLDLVREYYQDEEPKEAPMYINTLDMLGGRKPKDRASSLINMIVKDPNPILCQILQDNPNIIGKSKEEVPFMQWPFTLKDSLSPVAASKPFNL